MRNAPANADILRETCTGGHRHVWLHNGRARQAQAYPGRLCKEIMMGLIDQILSDRTSQAGHVGVAIAEAVHDWDDDEDIEGWVDIQGGTTGEALRPDLIKKALGRGDGSQEAHGV